MRYKPERALTPPQIVVSLGLSQDVEMRYKPERALTLMNNTMAATIAIIGRNEV